jgi:predicted nucleotidyltransferase
MAAKLTVSTVAAQLQEQSEQLKNLGVQSLALFGSVARNESTPSSDLDFLVEFRGRASFDQYMDLKFLLEDLFEVSVDLVMKHTLKPQIRQRVLAEAIHVA